MSTRGPLVSIGLPVYNGATHVADAIRSVLAQEYENVELVISDNASDDETESICREFAKSDPRVRYLRNATNIGLVPNFMRVRDEATGKYFCWLTHDDLLSDTEYIAIVVDYLEAHPDVVCCHTASRIISDPAHGHPPVVEFPELAPERYWPDVRRDLFRWPRGWLELASQGMFRHEELAKIRIADKMRSGRPHIFCWEIDLLTDLARRGRIVALPQTLRTYRSSAGSAAHRMGRDVSSFDLFILGLEMRTILICRALMIPASAIDRVRLFAVALSNLFRPAFRRRFDHRYQMRLAKREFAGVLKAADKRAKVLSILRDSVWRRQQTLQRVGIDPQTPEDPPVAVPAPVTDRSLRTSRGLGFLTDIFRRPSVWHVRRLEELRTNATIVRNYCEAQLREIEYLHAEAARLLQQIEMANAGKR